MEKLLKDWFVHNWEKILLLENCDFLVRLSSHTWEKINPLVPPQLTKPKPPVEFISIMDLTNKLLVGS